MKYYKCINCQSFAWKVHVTTYHKVLRIVCCNCEHEEDFQ